ncbi:triose-phosphate isomerase [bacterium]|nr:MAG: triose-phosphate isomerase [bacterium]
MFILNLKNYKLTNRTYEVIDKLNVLLRNFSNVNFLIAPNIISTRFYVELLDKLNSNIKVLGQHADFIDTPKSTGFISPELLKNLGTWGTILNHAEHNIDTNILRHTVKICNELDLKTIVCFDDVCNTVKYISLHPTFISYEPRSLIGGGNSFSSKSVIDQEMQNLMYLKSKFDEDKIILGAGIKSENDFIKTYELGFAGVMISSVVTENEDFFGKLEELLNYENMYSKSFAKSIL